MSTTRRPIRQRLVFAASAAGVLFAMAVPSVASAAGAAAVNWGQLSYVDLTSSANRLTVTPSGSRQYNVVDTTGVNAGDGCTQVSFTEATCSGVYSFYVNVGNGDDEVALNVGAAGSGFSTILGGNGADRLFSGPGPDSIYGGDGADTIDPGPGGDRADGGAGPDVITTRDGTKDTLDCGTESDSGEADSVDSVDTDCESVSIFAPTAGTGPAEPTSPGDGSGSTAPGSEPQPDAGATTPPLGKIDPLANPLPVLIPAQTPRLDLKAALAAVKVACPAGFGHCKGTVVLEVLASHLGKASASAAAAKLVKVGDARFVAKAGAKPLVKVRLSRRGRRRVIRGRKRQRCRITVTTTSPTGRTLVTRRTVTLVPQRRTTKRGSRR